MALHLNLLHEQILEQRQRQRDPLKIGMLILIGCGAVMFGYYSWNAYRTLEIKSRLGAIERNWAKIEPKVTTAQKRVSELQGIVKTTRMLDDYIDGRFFWAPFLQKGRPEKSTIDIVVKHARRFDDTLELAHALLRGCHLRFDLGPVSLNRAEPAFDFEGTISVPRVIPEHDCAAADQDEHADLERVALPLALFQNLLVEKVEVKSHRLSAAQVFKGRPAGDVERHKFVRQRLTFSRRQGDFACLERVPDFAGQAKLVAQRLENGFEPGEAARDKNPENVFFALPFKEADGIAHFRGKPGERHATNIGHAGIALLNQQPGRSFNRAIPAWPMF